ncbi:CRAL/TRIO domain protein [Trichuris suis]|nr:CRAL/TRIO domain protein [Trichuris suis]
MATIDFGIDLPDELNTEINLNRWLTGWQCDVEKIRPVLQSYVENRRAAGFDDPQFLKNFTENQYIKKVLPLTSISTTPMVVNEKDNSIVVINRLGGVDHHKVTLATTPRELLMFYFTIAEYFYQQVLEQEKRSGKPSGITLIYDYEGFNLLEYANPRSPTMQLFSLGAMLLQDYYCELLTAFYLVNASSWIKVILGIAKKLLHPRTLGKVHFITGDHMKEELPKRISLNALPVEYGGNWTECGPNVDPRTCCSVNKPITDELYFKPSIFPNKSRVWIPPNKKYCAVVTVTKGGCTLKWQFFVSSAVSFAVSYKDGEESRLLLPRLVICTPHGEKLPEEGSIFCDGTGKYALEFWNVSSTFFSLRLDLAYSLSESVSEDITRVEPGSYLNLSFTDTL